MTAPGWHDPASSLLAGPDDSPEGRRRNIENNRREDEAYAPGYGYIDEVLRQLGVAVPGGYNSNTRYRLPDVFLQLGAESFEYPLYDRAPNLHFTGPILHKEEGASTVPDWLHELDSEKPVIFITQGTLANFDFKMLINPALAGLAEDNLQLIVSAGGGKSEMITAPHNAIVKQYIRYETVLPKTSVFVTERWLQWCTTNPELRCADRFGRSERR